MKNLLRIVLLICASLPLNVIADNLKEEDNKSVISFTFENDYFSGSDDGYTNGFRLAYASKERNIPWWLDQATHLIPLFAKNSQKRYGFAFGQTMYTPRNLENQTLIEQDRPYAGYSFLSAGVVGESENRLDNFQLTLGLVGESSLADKVQEEVHRLADTQDPKGWDNQLKDELGLTLTYERKYRGLVEFSPFGFGADISPHFGASVGNIDTSANIGAYV